MDSYGSLEAELNDFHLPESDEDVEGTLFPLGFFGYQQYDTFMVEIEEIQGGSQDEIDQTVTTF